METFEGRYSDGRSADSRPVLVAFEAEGLAVRETGGDEICRWAYGDLGLLEPARPGRPLRMLSAAAPDARLTVAHPRAVQALRQRLPSIKRARPVQRRGRLGMVALVLSVLAVAVGSYLALPLVARPIAQAIPLEWEERWGGAFAAMLVDELGGACGGAGQTVLDDLASRIARANGLTMRFHVHVVRHDMVNAFAAPGGHLVLLKGLLADARSPDEVAGVLAHEMAHVVERHAMARMVRNVGVGVLVALVTGDPSGLLATAGAVLVSTSYSRDDEAEADAVGVELLTGAGLATHGLGDFFGRLAEREKGSAFSLPAFLSTHPASERRAEAIPRHSGQAALSEDEWAAVKAACG